MRRNQIKVTNTAPRGGETIVIYDAESALPVARLRPGESKDLWHKSQFIRGMGRMLLFQSDEADDGLPDNVVKLTQRGAETRTTT